MVFEDIDFAGTFCYPPDKAFQRYSDWYCEVIARRGGDALLGPQLQDLCLDAGLRENLERALDGIELAPIPAIATGDVTRRPQLRFGTVITGDQFINCEATRLRLFDRFAAQAVEMEGAAVAQIAERFDVPCVIVRSLSDLAGADSHMDIRTFLSITAGQAATVVRRIIPVV